MFLDFCCNYFRFLFYYNTTIFRFILDFYLSFAGSISENLGRAGAGRAATHAMQRMRSDTDLSDQSMERADIG